MQHTKRSIFFPADYFIMVLIVAVAVTKLHGQATTPSASSTTFEPPNLTTEQANQQDYQNMKEQLGIKKLRPGPSGRAGATNSANYDPAKANPFPTCPIRSR